MEPRGARAAPRGPRKLWTAPPRADRMPLLVLLALAGLTALPIPGARSAHGAADEELREKLFALTSPEAAVRWRAERWLGAHLSAGDAETLAAAALAGDAEVRQRLVRALGSDDRHLGLAAELAGRAEGDLAALGEQALRELAARWSEGSLERGVSGRELAARLARLAERTDPTPLVVDLADAPATTIALVSAHAGLPFGLVLDPALAAASPPGERGLRAGPWHQIVQDLANDWHVGLEGFGLEAPESELREGVAWLRFAPRHEAGRVPGFELVLRWIRAVAASEDASGRAAAARALGRLGWPAALGWLEERWTASDDEAALLGLVAAAEGGQVGGALAEPARFEALVARAVRGVAAADPAERRHARSLLRALARVGGHGPAGEDLASAAVRAAEAAGGDPAVARWTALALVEALGAAGDERVLASAREALAGRAAFPPVVRRQALFAWNALARARGAPPPPPALADPAALWSGVERPADADALARGLAAAGLAPPAEWRTPEGLPAGLDATGRVGVLAWWLWSGDVGTAAGHAVALARDPAGAETGERLARVLRPPFLAGERVRVGAFLGETRRALAAEPQAEAALDRTALLIGALPPVDVDALAARALAPPVDWALVGALAGLAFPAAGERARAAVQAALESALAEGASLESAAPVLRAAERALTDLYSLGPAAGPSGGREGPLAVVRRRFLDALRRTLSGAPDNGLRAALVRGAWPLPPQVEPRPLGATERFADAERLVRPR